MKGKIESFFKLKTSLNPNYPHKHWRHYTLSKIKPIELLLIYYV